MLKQITVTTPASSPGLLAEICRALADHDVNILDIDIEEDRRKATIVLIAEPAEIAETVLIDEGFTVEAEPTLLIKLRDEPGSIARIAERLKDEAINILSMHVLHLRGNDALIALNTANNDAAAKALDDVLVKE